MKTIVNTEEDFQITAGTKLGYVSITGSRAGITAINFVDATDANCTGLPRDIKTQALVREALQSINNPHRGILVPLQCSGTSLQQAVWRHLQSIPVGSTMTYAEIARAIGAPRAYRAVANACGANKVAILVPCHRAIRSDGSYGGYRWGIDKKREILAWEKRALPSGAAPEYLACNTEDPR